MNVYDSRFPAAYAGIPGIMDALENVCAFRFPVPPDVIPETYRRMVSDAYVYVKRAPEGYLSAIDTGGHGVVHWGIFDDMDHGGSAWDGAKFTYRGELHRADIYRYTLSEALALIPRVLESITTELNRYIAAQALHKSRRENDGA